MESDAPAPGAGLDADLVFEALGHLASAVALDLLDIGLGEDGGHAPRVVVSASQRPVFQGLLGWSVNMRTAPLSLPGRARGRSENGLLTRN